MSDQLKVPLSNLDVEHGEKMNGFCEKRTLTLVYDGEKLKAKSLATEQNHGVSKLFLLA